MNLLKSSLITSLTLGIVSSVIYQLPAKAHHCGPFDFTGNCLHGGTESSAGSECQSLECQGRVRTKIIPEGRFKFEGRTPIYYSNGKGQYCWYQSWEDFKAMTDGTYRIQSGKLSGYTGMNYDGICGGPTGSRPGPHPDPNF